MKSHRWKESDPEALLGGRMKKLRILVGALVFCTAVFAAGSNRSEATGWLS